MLIIDHRNDADDKDAYDDNDNDVMLKFLFAFTFVYRNLDLEAHTIDNLVSLLPDLYYNAISI